MLFAGAGCIGRPTLAFCQVSLVGFVLHVCAYGQNIDISSDYVRLSIDETGKVLSLYYQDDPQDQPEQLHPWGLGELPLSTLFYSDVSDPAVQHVSDVGRMRYVGEDRYQLEYDGLPTLLTLTIRPESGYFLFRIEEVTDPPSGLDKIHFYQIVPHRSVQLSGYSPHREWLLNSSESTLFMHSLSLNIDSICGLKLVPYSNGSSYYSYRGLASSWLKSGDSSYVGATGVLIAAPKSIYFSTIREMVRKYNLPYREENGEWFRESDVFRESYFFTKISDDIGNATHYENVLSLMKRSGDTQLLVTNPMVYGSYTIPRHFPSWESFLRAVQLFQDNGIKVGIHTFLNRISTEDVYFSPHRPGERIMKVPIGTLASSLTATLQTIEIIKDEDTRLNFHHYADNFYNRLFLLIENEIMECAAYQDKADGSRLTIGPCSRGAAHTQAGTHAQGTMVYLAPYSSTGFLVDPEDESAKDEAASAFADFIDRTNINFIYADGYPMIPEPGMPDEVRSTYQEKVGVLPYIERLDFVPGLQYGNQGENFNYYYANRSASWDGPPFKAKEFTREFKVKQELKRNTPYRDVNKEMGWWKITGAQLERTYDFGATMLDDVYYAMTKVMAYDTSMGLQMGPFWDENERLYDLLDLMKSYKDLIRDDISDQIIPQHIKDHFQGEEREGELTIVNGYNLIEKYVHHEKILLGDPNSTASTFYNPFGRQKLKIDIRPAFDYYSIGDSRHIELSDFQDTSGITIQNSANVTCDLSDGGQMVINNTGDSYGTTTLSLFQTVDNQYLDLSGHRGMGLGITGDGKNELLFVRLLEANSAVRDFRIDVDFSGMRALVLNDPTTEIRDVFYTDENGTEVNTRLPFSAGLRSWAFAYNRVKAVQLVIHVRPQSVATLRFHFLKALKEKENGSPLVNPGIQVNGRSITFPVTLYVDDRNSNILEYSGYTKEYRLLTSNFEHLSTGEILQDTIVVNHGVNEFRMRSIHDTASASNRAEIRISVYDDEDDDGIPTHGSYLEQYSPRDPTRGRYHFYDDNDPYYFNPDQVERTFETHGVSRLGVVRPVSE